MKAPQKPPIESLAEAEWAMLSSHVQVVIGDLVEENGQLKLTIAKLEEQLRRNSQNSSQPPSQDKAAQKQVQEETRCSARRRGGQVGHVGRGRQLLAEDAVDAVVVHRPTACHKCGTLLLGYDNCPQRHQLTEIPLGKPIVTEHQVHSVVCPCCGILNRGTLPPAVAASQFGPNLVSVMAVLMGCYRLSKRQVVALLPRNIPHYTAFYGVRS